REGEAEHADGAGRLGGAAGDARTRRAPAREERQSGELVSAQALEHGRPRAVELMRRRGRAAAGDAVRLLDERDGEALLQRDALRRNDVRRSDAAARTVPEHERSVRRFGVVQVDARRSVRCLDHERRQHQMILSERAGLMHASESTRGVIEMGRIVVTEFVSLDGVMEDPGGAEDYKYGGWTFEIERGDEGNKFKLDETEEAEALLLGRVTYEGFAEAWPSRTGGFA